MINSVVILEEIFLRTFARIQRYPAFALSILRQVCDRRLFIGNFRGSNCFRLTGGDGGLEKSICISWFMREFLLWGGKEREGGGKEREGIFLTIVQVHG